MSKAMIVAFRAGLTVDGRSFSAAISAAMTPDNLSPAPPIWCQEPGLFSLVLNPSPVVRTQGNGVCLGRASCYCENLFQTESSRPDGTFALFRADGNQVEVLTDYAGTRTIWYLHTDTLFVAATSQRTILAVVGNFEFDPLSLKWMLSSGTTGPGISWDKRIKMIEPHSRVVLNRHTWVAEYTRGSNFHFTPQPRSVKEHRTALETAVQKSVQDLEIKSDQWALALSGGMDSRAILYFLKSSQNLNLVTWGTEG